PEMFKSALSGRIAESDYYNGQTTGKLLVWADPEEARQRVAELTDEARDKSNIGAIGALAGIGPEARAAVPVLISLLSDAPSEESYWATVALGQIGPDAAPAVPRLIAN